MEYNEEYKELEVAEEAKDNTAEETVQTTEEYTPQFADVNVAEETPVVAKPKKKFPIYIPIIIAACLVLVSLVSFFAISIFTPTIEGTWLYASEEGYDFYYTFDKKGTETDCTMNIGTSYFPGTYEVTDTEDGKSVSVNVSAGYVYGVYDFEITGNKLARNRVLTLTAEDGSVIELKQTKKTKDSDFIMPDENFKEVEALTGEWEFYYPEYDMSVKLTLNDDGTMVYDQFGMQELHCVYTATDSTINLSFFETELISQEEGYYFDGDQLIFLGLNWTKAGTSTADEAK